MDLDIKILRKKIIDTLNESAIPIEVKRLMLAEILAEVKESVNEVVQKQIEERNSEREEINNGN